MNERSIPPDDPFTSRPFGEDFPPALKDPFGGSNWEDAYSFDSQTSVSNQAYDDGSSRFSRLRDRVSELRPGKRAVALGIGVLTVATMAGGVLRVTGDSETQDDKTEQLDDYSAPAEYEKPGDVTSLVESISTTTEATTTTTEAPITYSTVFIEGDESLAVPAAPTLQQEFFPQMEDAPDRVDVDTYLAADEYRSQYSTYSKARYVGNETGGLNCVGADMMIPSNISEEAQVLAERYSPLLSQEQLESINESLESLESVEEIEVALRDTFKFLGVQETAFSEENKDLAKPEGYVPPRSDPERFKTYAKEVLTGLRYVPAEALAGLKTIELTDSHNLGKYEETDTSISFTSGQHYGGSESKIVLSGSSDLSTFVHEVMHHVHETACQGSLDTDQTLHGSYTDALALMSTIGVSEEKLDSFPSEYSKESYVELFAELSTALALNGIRTEEDLAAMDPEARGAYLLLQEQVIERMKEGMPETDVLAWLQLQRLYAENEATQLIQSETPEGVSMFDLGFDQQVQQFASSTILPGRNTTLDPTELQNARVEPAVIIQQADGSVRTIDARILSDGQRIVIVNENSPAEIKDAVEEYVNGSSAERLESSRVLNISSINSNVNDPYKGHKGPFNDQGSDLLSFRIYFSN